MYNRHLTRSILLQSLYAHDWQPNLSEKEEVQNMSDIMEEYAPGIDRPRYIETMYLDIVKKLPLIDQVLAKAAPKFPLSEMNRVDKNILRIGIYELVFGDYDEVPPKAAINEAVELARAFSGGKSKPFINGVLGSVFEELGLPNTMFKRAKKTEEKEEEIVKEIPLESKAGAMVYAVKDDKIFIMLSYDVFGKWSFTKGDVIEGETKESAVARIVKDERGIDIAVGEEIGTQEYLAFYPDRGEIKKQVVYFLGESKECTEPNFEHASSGIRAAKWYALD